LKSIVLMKETGFLSKPAIFWTDVSNGWLKKTKGYASLTNKSLYQNAAPCLLPPGREVSRCRIKPTHVAPSLILA
jgi:hypothetical protein